MNAPASKTQWMPQDKSATRRSTLVLGARIKRQWLERTVSVVEVRFIGELAQALGDLRRLAKATKDKNLPTVRLKARLALTLDGVISVDKHLGLDPERPSAAIELYRDVGDKEELCSEVRSALKHWNQDVVQRWAQRNSLEEAARRLSAAIADEWISIDGAARPLVDSTAGSRLGRPRYHLIARMLAEQLVGEELFEGLGPVDMVLDPADSSASAELMTVPQRMGDGRNVSVFSMAARLSVLTMPFSQDLFFKITPVKRVWAPSVPGNKPNAPPNVACTVMVPDKPFLLARATRTKDGWVFAEDYEEFLARSQGKLPAKLEQAVAELVPDTTKGGWWVGLPKLPTLFDRIGGRTVFEGDEQALFETVISLLPSALDPKLDFRRVKAMPQKALATLAALQPADLGQPGNDAEAGRAGAALAEDDLGDDEKPPANEPDTKGARQSRIAAARAENVATLAAVHQQRKVHLFVFGGESTEQAIVRACARELFGHMVDVHTEALPANTHGLQADLELPRGKGRDRFEARVKRWSDAFKQLPDDGIARHVLVCADRVIGRKTEDQVNYYAAIHAACEVAAANVHYVLPIQQKKGKDDVDHFVHRVQSALLDVFLAHSGAVLGVRELVQQTIGVGREALQPKYVYGIQALRSRARRRSAEANVSFLLYTRLPVATGLVEARVVCCLGTRDHTTEWMPLAQVLRWIGQQRTITSDEPWLKNAFDGSTRAFLAEASKDDPNGVVLIDWQRLKGLWPAIRDDMLCESPDSTLMLGGFDMARPCRNMTFVRLRHDRETSMSVRRLVKKIYEGWRFEPTLEPTGEVYTESYVVTGHEIVQLQQAPEAGAAPRLGRPHFLQVMTYRRTMQLSRGYSCYRGTERMKPEAPADGQRDGPKRFKLVRFAPSTEDAALPATMEITVLARPEGIDIDQVARLIMGLRLRYAHYDDWTSLPAPLFFIAKADDYVIPYADLARDQDDQGQSEGSPDIEASTPVDSEQSEIEAGEDLRNDHNPYLDDVAAEVREKLPSPYVSQGDSDATAAGVQEGSPQNTEAAVADGGAGAHDIPEDATEEPQRPPADPLLAKAWELARDVPVLYHTSNPNQRRAYEELMCGSLRVSVELPWFVRTAAVIAPEAWPDRKSISRFWRQQGGMGLRRANKAAPSAAEFKQWVMQRLRYPQSCWSLSAPQLFKGDARLLGVAHERYEQLLAQCAREETDPPKAPSGASLNVGALAEWLRQRNDDQGIAWLTVYAAHFPGMPGVAQLFHAIDGMQHGPMTQEALAYFIDSCEVAIELAAMSAAQRRTAVIQRRRNQVGEQQMELELPRKPAVHHEAPSPRIEAAQPAAVALQVAATAGASASGVNTGESVPQPRTALAKALNTMDPPTAIAARIPPAKTGGQQPVQAEPASKVDADMEPAAQPVDEPAAPVSSNAAETVATEVLGAQVQLEKLRSTIERLVPGTASFEGARDAIAEALEQLQREHDASLEEHRRSREIEERNNARITQRKESLEAIFDALKAACASIPPDILDGQGAEAPQCSPALSEQAATAPDQELAATMDLLRATLRSVQEAAAELAAAHEEFVGLESGSDARLGAAKGFERRRLASALMQALTERTHAANERLRGGLALCADPTGWLDSLVEPPPHQGAAALEPRQAETVALPDTATASTREAPTATARSDGSSASAAGPAAAATVARAGATAPETAAHVVPVEPAPNEPFDTVVDQEADEPLSTEDLDTKTIEVSDELDIELLDQRTEPLQRAARDHLWTLCQVGAQALQCVNPHPELTQHTTTWASILGSLAGLASHGGSEQALDEGLLRRLQDSEPTRVADAERAFALDVGVLAAGLLPILFEGHDAKARWAVLPRVRPHLQDHRPLAELCELLQTLDSSAFTLNRENLSASRVGPRKALEAEVARQRERAAKWSDDPVLFTNWPSPEYWEMHKAMFDDRHGMHIHKALGYLARGADEQLHKMMPELRKYVEKMRGTLADLAKRTGRRRSLEGPHTEKLAHNIQETVDFMANYLDLTGRLKSMAKEVDVPRNLRDFLDPLHAKLRAADAYLKDFEADLGDDLCARGVVRLHYMLARQVLQCTLALMDESEPESPLTPDEQMLLMDVPLDSTLHPVHAVKLEPDDEGAAVLRDPLVIVNEVGSVQESVAAAAQARPPRSPNELLLDAADRHRKGGEMLAARAIEQRLRNATQQVLTQEQAANDLVGRRQRTQLQDELTDARERVTNALSVGAMTQADANRMLKVVETLARANTDGEIGRTGATPTPYEDYPQARAVLRHHVLEPLERRIREGTLQLKTKLAEFEENLRKNPGEEASDARKLEQLARIESMLRDGTPISIRVAHHAFSLLCDNQLPLIRLDQCNPALAYETFQHELAGYSSSRTPLESLRDALRSTEPGKGCPKAGEPGWMQELDSAQRDEAARFIDTWIELAEARSLQAIHEPLAAFFSAVGTAESPTAMSEPGNSARTAFHFPPKTFVGSERLGIFVPPVLGSAARDIRGVVLRNRPQPEVLAQVVEELPVTTPSFVLARSRLTLAKRSAISGEHPVLIVDDDLVAYMAVHPEQRLAKMMEVGLLTFHDNPYDDYGGPVPREMFFGRRNELQRLWGNKSALVLYGGRRLGKSSLLDRIQMESRQHLVRTADGARGEVAIYIPLDSKMDAAVFGDDYKLFAWRGIYRGLVHNGFIHAARTEPASADAIRTYITQEIMAGRCETNACYLLIDEADDVMGKDLAQGALFATGLQALCDDVRDVCRVRYVIAGLHNLTRMHTEGNTTLAKADAIALQPFSSGQDIMMGVELITKPLAALGFVFPKGAENQPLRILELCNFYPAFVQLYCKNLIQDLYNKRAGKAPTTAIEAADLDKVERNKDFLGEMQKKFAYNLDLDKRYKAIALTLADTYHSGGGAGLEQGLTASEIRNFCQEIFANHFKNTGEGACTALLEEMEKLTVIERKGARYQLRTPRIAMMMGSRDDVDHMIDELARETPVSDRVPGESRPIMRRNLNEQEVFPMSSAWVRKFLHSEERELVVLVGNHLSGLPDIERGRGEWELAQDGVYEPKVFSGADSARSYINSKRRISGNQPTHCIIGVPPRSWNPGQIDDYAAVTASLARPLLGTDQRQRAANLRLLLIASPDHAWEIAQRLQAEGAILSTTASSLDAGRRRWRVDAVPCWSEDAVYYRLKQVENQTLPDNPQACREILEATCGYGGEIVRVARAGLAPNGIVAAQADAQQRLAPTLPEFYSAIGLPGALRGEAMKPAEELLSLVDGEKRTEGLTRELATDCGVSLAQLVYLQWMGLLQEAGDGTWRVPELYLRLLASNAEAKAA